MRATFAGCLMLVGGQLVTACGAPVPDVAALPDVAAPSALLHPGDRASREERAQESPVQASSSTATNESAQQGPGESPCPPGRDSSSSSSEGSVGTKNRGGEPSRDYAIRVGIGFTEEEVGLLELACETWARATGLPLHLRGGYGPLGNFHIAEAIPVCGQSWVYDGYLGCYSSEFDSVVLNRPGLDLWMQEEKDILFIVLLHEIGHFLGLGHASDGEDSVMLPDYPTLARRPGELGALSERDVRAVCLVNPCQI